MSTIKATLPLDEETYHELQKLAEKERKSTTDLILAALQNTYGLSTRTKRQRAVKNLAKVNAPTGTWKEMEQEILVGRIR
jgi:predicted nucleic acid-binding protein